jgi:hypothetical protein
LRKIFGQQRSAGADTWLPLLVCGQVPALRSWAGFVYKT